MKYRNVGDHAEFTDDGQQVGVGEFVELDEDQVRQNLNEGLIASGTFLAVGDDSEHEASLAKRRQAAQEKKGTTNKDGEE